MPSSIAKTTATMSQTMRDGSFAEPITLHRVVTSKGCMLYVPPGWVILRRAQADSTILLRKSVLTKSIDALEQLKAWHAIVVQDPTVLTVTKVALDKMVTHLSGLCTKNDLHSW